MGVRAIRSLCYFLLGSIYLLAAFGKFQQPKAFLRSIIDYDLVPLPLVPLTAATMPGIELLAGVLMIGGTFVAFRRRRGLFDLYAEAATWIAAALLVVFIAVLSLSIARGISMDCGCFDILGSHIPFMASSTVDWGTVIRDVVMLALAYPVLAWRR